MTLNKQKNNWKAMCHSVRALSQFFFKNQISTQNFKINSTCKVTQMVLQTSIMQLVSIILCH